MELNQIKTRVAAYSKNNNITIQKAWDIFFFENFLYRLSRSKYSKNFILKGGFYLQSIVGIQMRSTMDIDLKYIGNKLDDEELKSFFTDICNLKKIILFILFLALIIYLKNQNMMGNPLELKLNFIMLIKFFL